MISLHRVTQPERVSPIAPLSLPEPDTVQGTFFRPGIGCANGSDAYSHGVAFGAAQPPASRHTFSGGLGGPTNKKGTTMTTEELRERFARKANLTDEHHDALTQLTVTDDRPVVLFEMGTEYAYGRSWS